MLNSTGDTKLETNLLSTRAAPDFSALFDAAPSPYLVLAEDLSIVAVNQAYLDATRTVRREILDRNIFEVFPDNPEDPSATGVAMLQASLWRVVQEKRVDTMAIQKYDIPVAQAGKIHFEERFWSPVNTPVFNAAGRLTHIIHCVEDVTEFVKARDQTARMASRIDAQALEIGIANRRLREANETLEQRVAARTAAQHLTEEKFRASELRFRLMADSIPQIVWIVDGSGRGVYFNKQWTAYTGVALDTIKPEEISSQFVHPDDHAATMEAWELAQASGTEFSVEHRIRSASGEYRWFLVRADPYQDPESGQTTLWFGTSTDVHDRKLAEAALRNREEQLRLAIDAADVGEWDVDMASGAMFWRERVKAMFGISADCPVTLADFYDGLHPDDRESTLASFAAAADPTLRTQYDSEYRAIGKEDGVIRWVAAKGRGVFSEAGECIRIIGTATDITKRKQYEDALRESEDRLRQADRRKDEFLAMLAHELRNPLAPIRAAADLLQIVKLDEQRVRQTSQIIARQVKHMTGLIDDLLDVSRVTRGLVTLETAPLDINQIISEAVEQASPVIRSRRHQLALQLTAEASCVIGDRKRLVQVLANLLNNAAKYTNEGGFISVQSQVDHDRVLVTVTDDGIGMRADLIACAFDLFAQAERSSDRASGGLGLGLALVKSIVVLHGGTVSCASAGPGKGSAFTVCLPLFIAAAPDKTTSDTPATVPHKPRASLKIMLVDDNTDAAAMLSLLLESLGHEVMVEHRSSRALARSKVDIADVFLLDIGLPEMDGNELAQRLRAQAETADAVMIAVTGYGQEQDRTQAFAAGFDHHLLKPVDFHKLSDILAEISPARR